MTDLGLAPGVVVRLGVGVRGPREQAHAGRFTLRGRAVHLLRPGPQGQDREDRGIQRQQDVACDVPLKHRGIQRVRAQFRSANRDQQVDGVQRTENEQRKSCLAIGKLGDVEQMSDVIR